jgi:hypothetical protein
MRDGDPRLRPIYAYLIAHPDAALARWREQIAMLQPMFARSNMTGHSAASDLVLTPDCAEVLLIHHLGRGKWLAPAACR